MISFQKYQGLSCLLLTSEARHSDRTQKKSRGCVLCSWLRSLASSRIYCSGVTLVSQLVMAVVE